MFVLCCVVRECWGVRWNEEKKNEKLENVLVGGRKLGVLSGKGNVKLRRK